jgi:hypothetical protein
MVFDDFINGNVTNDGQSFFAGLPQIKSKLNELNGNLSIINNTLRQILPSNSNFSDSSSKAATVLSDTAKITKGVNASGNIVLQYNTPLNAAITNSTVSSKIPSILGSSGTGGLVGEAYTMIQ